MQFHHHEGQPWIRRGFPTANPCSCLPSRRNLVRSSVDFRLFFFVCLRYSRRGRILFGESLLRPVSLTRTQPLGDSETLSSNFRFRWNWEANKFCLPEGVDTRVSCGAWLTSVCPVVRKCGTTSKGQQEALNVAAKAPFTARLPEIARQRTPRETRPPGC